MKAALALAAFAVIAATGAAPHALVPVDFDARRTAVVARLVQQPESRVLAAKARAAVKIMTSAGPVVLWAAPTRGGGQCYLVDIHALPVQSGGAMCSAPPARRDVGIRPWHTETRVGNRVLELLGARVGPNVASVEARFADGESDVLRPSGGFALRELRRGEEPVAVIARDDRGALLARRPMPGPRSYRRDLPFPIAGYRTVIALEAARLAVAPGTNGTLCTQVTSRGTHSWSCGLGPGRLAAHALNVQRQRSVLYGEVGSAITRLEVWFEDGAAARVPIVERYVLFEVPRGRRPRLVVGLDAAGAIVARQRL